MKMTKHAQVDRISRLEYICDTVGIGEVVAEINEIDEYGNTLSKKLTDTGVIIIVSVNYNRTRETARDSRTACISKSRPTKNTISKGSRYKAAPFIFVGAPSTVPSNGAPSLAPLTNGNILETNCYKTVTKLKILKT